MNEQELLRQIKNEATVFFCNSNKAWGGGERWHLEASLYLAAREYHVILACGRGTPLWEAAKDALARRPELSDHFRMAHCHFGNFSFLNPFKGAAFARYLMRSRITHMVLNLPADLKMCVMAAGKKNIPAAYQGGGMRIFYRRGSAIPVKNSTLNRMMYAGLAGVIANSMETARCVQQARVIDADKIHVLYNGLDISAFDDLLRNYQNVTGVGAMREWPGPGRGTPLYIGNAGRLNKQKGQKYLLHMSAELKRRGLENRLLIAGGGELEKDLRALAGKLGLRVLGAKEPFTLVQEELAGSRGGSGPVAPSAGADSARGPAWDVCFCGHLENMSALWRGIDLFVLSSLWEGFGYVLAEAMLAERPVLAFDNSSTPELIRDGHSGSLIAPPQSGESDEAVGKRLAEAALALAENPDLMRRMGQAGREFTMNNFDQKKAMHKLERLLFWNEPVAGAEMAAQP